MTGRYAAAVFAIIIVIAFLAFVAAPSYVTHRWTRYSPGFTEEKWKSVTNGMSSKTLEAILGEPLRRDDSANLYQHAFWRYTLDRNSIWYRSCVIELSNEVVIKKWDDFYWD